MVATMRPRKAANIRETPYTAAPRPRKSLLNPVPAPSFLGVPRRLPGWLHAGGQPEFGAADAGSFTLCATCRIDYRSLCDGDASGENFRINIGE